MPSFPEQVIHLAQSEFQKSEKAEHPDLNSIQSLATMGHGLQKKAFKQLIDQLQLAKYPHPPFTCQQQMIDIEGKKIPVTYIKTEDPINLTQAQLHEVNVNSLLLRKVALAATLESYATKHVKGSEALNKIRGQLQDLVKKSIDEAIEQAKNPNLKLDAYKETNQFINELGTILNSNTPLQDHAKAVKIIKHYERYVLSEMNAGRVIINESTLTTNKGKKNILQMDIPLDAKLTEQQKNEYLKILNPEKPEWFKNGQLEPFEQEWYEERVTRAQKTPDGWEKFTQEVYSTCAMQQALELKNARKNYFFIDKQLQSESTKNATLNAIEVTEENNTRKKLTLQNANQLIENQIQGAEEHFKNHWGLSPEKKLPGKIMIASQSLLSPLLGLADDKMISAQKEAIKTFAKDPRYKDKYQIVFGNDAVNILRKSQTIDWTYTDHVMTYSKDLISKLIKSGVDDNHPQMKLMNAALNQLEELKNSTNLKDRNKAAFKTALMSILIEASGGRVSTNCKSGKDRTGLEELYHNAMLTYYNLYNELPGYNDAPEKRQRFIEIYTHLFNTLKIHESASGNTIGAFGIKDSAKMLCRDIAKALGDNYIQSNSRANLNKTEEALGTKIINKFNGGKTFVEPYVFKEIALKELEHRKHDLEKKSGKEKKIEALDQLIQKITEGQDLIPTLKNFLEDNENKTVFSSKLGLREDLTIKLIKKVIKEYEENNKLIEEKNRFQKKQQELQKLKSKVKEQQKEIKSIQTSLVQQQKNLEQEKITLQQLNIELGKVQQDLKTNQHQLEKIQKELSSQRQELNSLSSALNDEQKAAKDIDLKLKKESDSIQPLRVNLESQTKELDALEKKLEQQQGQIKSITDQITTQKTSLEQLNTGHELEKNTLDNLTELQTEKSELEALTKTLEEEQLKLKELTEQLEAKQSKLGKLTEHPEAKQLEFGQLTKQLEEERSKLGKLTEQIKAKQSKLDELIKQLKEVQSSLERENKAIAEKEANRWLITKLWYAVVSFFKSLPSLFSSSRSELDEDNPITQKETKISQLENEIKTLDELINQEKKTISEQKNKVERLDATKNEKENEIQSIQNLVKETNDINQKYLEQKNKVGNLESNISKITQKVQSLEKNLDNIGDIKQKVQEQTAKVEKFDSDISQKKQQIESLEKEKQSYQDKMKELESKIMHHQESRDSTQSKITITQESIQAQKNELAQKRTSIDEMKTHIDNKQQAINQNEKLIQTYESGIQKNQTTLGRLNDQITQQESKIKTQEKKMESNPNNQSVSMKQKLQETKMQTKKESSLQNEQEKETNQVVRGQP